MQSAYWSTASATYLDREAVVRELGVLARRLTAARPDVTAVLLFGSLARGGGSPGSDADLVVVLKTSPHARRMDRLPDLTRALAGAPVPLDVHPYTVAELKQGLAAGDPFLTVAVAQGVVLSGAV